MGSYGSNGAGLSDMVGSVSEWTSDCSEVPDYPGRFVCDPVGSTWLSPVEDLRPGVRFRSPAVREIMLNHWIGFRVSRQVDY